MRNSDQRSHLCRPRWLIGTGDQEVVGSTPAGSATLFRGYDHEIVPTVILSLPLIQEGQFSVLAKECAQHCLTASRTQPAQ